MKNVGSLLASGRFRVATRQVSAWYEVGVSQSQEL